ncbi:hypothetical protein RRF57_008603 [Xylaria bambusicola]|uniref:Uncharacterized protein n=1 Tax=Xylaria bambusicola TaxID=326684 RepID=A0AAN7UI52_9PEZI
MAPRKTDAAPIDSSGRSSTAAHAACMTFSFSVETGTNSVAWIAVGRYVPTSSAPISSTILTSSFRFALPEARVGSYGTSVLCGHGLVFARLLVAFENAKRHELALLVQLSNRDNYGIDLIGVKYSILDFSKLDTEAVELDLVVLAS